MIAPLTEKTVSIHLHINQLHMKKAMSSVTKGKKPKGHQVPDLGCQESWTTRDGSILLE